MPSLFASIAAEPAVIVDRLPTLAVVAIEASKIES